MKIFSPHKIALATLDFGLVNSSFLLALWFQYLSGYYYPATQIPYYTIPGFAIFSLLLIAIFQTQGLYKYQVSLSVNNQIVRLFKSLVYGLVLFVTISFLFKTRYVTQSRLVIGLTFSYAFFLLTFVRCGIARWAYLYLAGKGLRKKALIVGAGKKGQRVLRSVQENKNGYFEVVGFADDNPRKIGKAYEEVRVLGGVKDIRALIRDNHVDEVLVAIDRVSHERLLEIVDACKVTEVTVHVVSDLYEVITQKVEVEEFGELPTVRFPAEPNGIVRSTLKRAVDLVGASVFLAILSPFFLIVSLLIKLSSKGPVFYRTTVIGAKGRPFVWYKFRSMEVDGDERIHREHVQELIADGKKTARKLREDPRVTLIGRFLRRHSLDELPHLFNVLSGQMTLVGPRPCLPYEWEAYKPWYKRRLNVKPGMTGLWQVTGRDGVGFDDMVVLDLYYINNKSFFMDIGILLKTIPVVLFGKGGH